MLVRHTTQLNVDVEVAWEELQKPTLLEYVARPLMTFRFVGGRPERWAVGEYAAALRLFGILPLGQQVIGLEMPATDGSQRRLRDNGYSRLIRTWDHMVVLDSTGAGQSTYTDEIRIEAGVLTPLVAVFAWVFYLHRQRRWRKLVATGFDYTR